MLVIFSGLKNVLHFASASRGVGRMGRSCERSLKMTTENENQNKKKSAPPSYINKGLQTGNSTISINRSSYLRNTLDCMHVRLVTFILHCRQGFGTKKIIIIFFFSLWPQIVNSSWTPATNKTQYSGAMTDLVIVECLLPDSPVRRTQYDENIEGIPAAGLTISVSNNGIHESKEKLKFISYDSVCMACNVSTGCVLKVTFCAFLVYLKFHNQGSLC